LSLSSDNQREGTVIVWVSIRKGGENTGVLRAYDAANLQNKLFEQTLDPKSFVKFVPPTIADGRVYMAEAGKVAVFDYLCAGCPLPPRCTASTDCAGTLRISCSGQDVGVVFNGNCYNLYGEPTPCYAGFTGASTVSAGGDVYWIGSRTLPNCDGPGRLDSFRGE
jgi:hypothetical protein